MDLSQWLEYIQRQHPESIELGLDRVREVATRLGLGRPAAQVITVAGTNGKGSTVAFIEAIARAGGWKVGAYTSPHLLRYNERVRIEAEEVADDALVAAFAVVEAARVDTPLTYFEFGTLAALWLFQRASLDLVVLEVGLGGRLDAVNLVDADVAVVTTVDIDHTGWLGSDRESIGREKAGIARAWKPLVLGEVDPPSSVLRHAYAIGANAIRLGSDFFHEPVDAAHWRWREVGAELRLPAPRLAAPPQRANASTAIAALRALPRALPEAAFAQGVATATLPGRLQCLQRDGVEIVLDVAHNPQAARELAAWLRRRIFCRSHGCRVWTRRAWVRRLLFEGIPSPARLARKEPFRGNQSEFRSFEDCVVRAPLVGCDFHGDGVGAAAACYRVGTAGAAAQLQRER